jgi:hypothetical protein
MISKLLQSFSVKLFILFISSLSILCCDNIKAEDNNYRLIKLHYENQSGEEGLTNFNYDQNGIMHQAYWELLDGSRSSTNYYTYDEEQNIVKKYREFSDGITSTQLYEYDEKGNLISEHFNRSDGVTGSTVYILQI